MQYIDSSLPTSKMARTEQQEIEQVWKTQVEDMGSEEAYRMADRKLANLEVDPFFYLKQLEIFIFRKRFLFFTQVDLKTIIPPEYDNVIVAFLATKCFLQVIEATDMIPLKISSTDGWGAYSKFQIPLQLMNSALDLHYVEDGRPCRCPECLTNLAGLTSLITDYPETPVLLERLLMLSPSACLAPASLKEQAIRRVLELGLDQDCLPSTLREMMKEGPEPRQLRESAERVMEVVHRVERELKGEVAEKKKEHIKRGKKRKAVRKNVRRVKEKIAEVSIQVKLSRPVPMMPEWGDKDLDGEVFIRK